MSGVLDTRCLVDLPALNQLIRSLSQNHNRVIGPVVGDGAVVLDTIQSLDPLPPGYSAQQEPGRYRLLRSSSPARFHYTVTPQGWKRFLHPPQIRLFEAQRDGPSFRIVHNPPPLPRQVFFGVRPCELAAIELLDRVFLHPPFIDPIYQARRRQTLLIAVNCTHSAPTCFCASLGTGPRALRGFDLALTELPGTRRPGFLVETGTPAGVELLASIPHSPASPATCRQADAAVARAARQVRSVDTTGLRDLLFAHLDHPRLEQASQRCLACANCTMVCPTCFCTSVSDTSSLAGDRAERWRHWDSCFTQDFSFIHGGTVRSSIRSRYRQWLTHKFASWNDQFSSPGCTGCGRCITWCPAGIDLTEELRAIRRPPKSRPEELAQNGPVHGRRGSRVPGLFAAAERGLCAPEEQSHGNP